MPGRVGLVWSEELMAYKLSEDHPLQPIRVKLAVEQMRASGLLEYASVLAPKTASRQELELVHDSSYIDLVAALSDPARRPEAGPWQVEAAGFGSSDNPVADGMHEAAATVVGASVVAAETVHSGDALHVFSPAGGLHHAQARWASGFCVYNDVAVAAAWLRERGHRVACVDVDVHHGDGTQAIFYADPEVLTVSLHESGRYLFPGTGFPDELGKAPARGTSVNLPLEPYCWDEPWLAAFEALIPLIRDFQPTVLVTQDGCDSHLLDPLAHLQTSTAIWPRIGNRFHTLAHELCQGRWVALGGGGYALREVVPRAWTLLFAEMVQRPELAAELIDPEPFPPSPEEQERVWRGLDLGLQKLSAELDRKLGR
ncbi:MAG: acetoin utilization protein AcuC [Candidatus Dormibacter sp.]|uniref:acetoin utilization protein AcuC n=1 Tax=Candidatus Dormibacter sp. TaxID=2973982 RepID=UPI003D9B7C97